MLSYLSNRRALALGLLLALAGCQAEREPFPSPDPEAHAPADDASTMPAVDAAAPPEPVARPLPAPPSPPQPPAPIAHAERMRIAEQAAAPYAALPDNIDELIASVPIDPEMAMPAELHAQVVALTEPAMKATGWVRVIAEVAVPDLGDLPLVRELRAQLGELAQLAGASGVSETEVYPYVAFTVPAPVLEALVRTGLIRNVWENALVRPSLIESIPRIDAYVAPRINLTGASPINGKDQVVVVVDTGVDEEHPVFSTGKIRAQRCFSTADAAAGIAANCPDGVSSGDDLCGNPSTGFLPICDHGTHVAGAIAGKAGAPCTPADQAAGLCPDLDGIAPEARVIALQVFSLGTNTALLKPCGTAAPVGTECLTANTIDVLRALEHVRTLATGATPIPNIVAVNMSFSGGLYSSTCDNFPLTAVLNDLRNLRIAAIAATGNGMSSTRIGWPACQSVAIATANSTDSDVFNPGSNRGPLVDLWAPGTNIVSTVPMPTRRESKTGTSMATPHVSAAFALMRQVVPSLTVADALGVLQSTGVPIVDGAVSPPRRRVNVGAALAQLTRRSVTPQVGDNLGRALAAGDFNGDGYTDLAVGVPGQAVGGAARAGAVDVFYGSASSVGMVQQWTQTRIGGGQASEAEDDFGFSVAVGRFNNDAYADLAIGSPGETVSGFADAGVVQVIYGSAAGLTVTGADLFQQGVGGLLDTSEANDQFGHTLATGDFDGNGRADLAIGTPFEDVGALADAGMVNVLYSANTGVELVNNQLWTQSSADFADTESAEAGDHFGFALATGRFDGGTHADLAIGAPREDVVVAAGTVADGGMVHILFGSSQRLRATPVVAGDGRADATWHQDSASVDNSVEANDRFGAALASNLFNNDTFADLAIGVPREDLENPAVVDAGAVAILHGSSTGPTASVIADQIWFAGVNGLQGASEASDMFGSTLATGDFNNDGRFDLAVGVPFENIENPAALADAGAVFAIYGTNAGLASANNQLFTQSITGNGTSAANEQFGSALASGNFNGPGPLSGNAFADLAIGAPLETVAGATTAGVTNVLAGSSSRLMAQTALASED